MCKRDNGTSCVYNTSLNGGLLYLQVVAVQHEDVDPNSVNIFWQVPQYIVMTIGECFFSVTGLSFAYSQVRTSP